jgi:transposase
MLKYYHVSIMKRKYNGLIGELDERARRMWAATEAEALGYGGIQAVASATGLAASTIRLGMRELKERATSAPIERRVRRAGGGRKSLMETDAELSRVLEALVDSNTRGDPMSPLRWTCKSTRNLAQELQRQGHPVSHATVASLLEELGYSLQSNRKTREGASNPDRNAQFEHINAKVKTFQRRGLPVISVDTKKKELIGDFKNGGREWEPAGKPQEVRSHDFPIKELGRAIPYGVYDVTRNTGWVSVGTDHDTAEFAVQSIRQWWLQMGRPSYPKARELLITADGGGSNGSRVRLWKVALQRFADESGLKIAVSHFPPGTSKWNKIEHRMFSHITKNWRGRPLETHEVVVNLIANTTTTRGLTIKASLDTQRYQKGIEVSDAEMAKVKIKKDNFHGDWNYTISGRQVR